jgi:uncharacterized protein YkwD
VSPAEQEIEPVIDGQDPELLVLEPEDFAVVDTPETIDLSYLGSTNHQEFEAAVIRLTNSERADRGLHALVRNEQLSRAALAQALDMAENCFISHTGSDGSNVADRVARAGYRNWVAVGENLAMGQHTAEEAVSGWMGSPGHRANLLSEKFNEIGVAYIEGDMMSPNGVSWRGGYWVQNFGTRLSMEQLAPIAARWWRETMSPRVKRENGEVEITILDERLD